MYWGDFTFKYKIGDVVQRKGTLDIGIIIDIKEGSWGPYKVYILEQEKVWHLWEENIAVIE